MSTSQFQSYLFLLKKKRGWKRCKSANSHVFSFGKSTSKNCRVIKITISIQIQIQIHHHLDCRLWLAFRSSRTEVSLRQRTCGHCNCQDHLQVYCSWQSSWMFMIMMMVMFKISIIMMVEMSIVMKKSSGYKYHVVWRWCRAIKRRSKTLCRNKYRVSQEKVANRILLETKNPMDMTWERLIPLSLSKNRPKNNFRRPEVRFVNAVTAGSSAKFLPVV